MYLKELDIRYNDRSTVFQARPGEDLTEKQELSTKYIIKKLIPPIFIDFKNILIKK